MGSASLLPFLLFLAGAAAALFPHLTAGLGFTCNSTAASCRAFAGYKVPNTTTFAAVQSLFNVTDLLSILGANNLPESTPANSTVTSGDLIRIPFPCACSNGTGTSHNLPTYTVISGDGLFHIATDVFSSLVTDKDIQAANNISNPDIIEIGQSLKIPLPCSCDPVDGEKVVHYAHVVVSGSSVEEISQQFDVSEDTLLRLNNLASAKDLLADVAFDVPLKACSSMISNVSVDSSLLVTNGTYVLTANNCVKCSCSSANNLTLQCQTSSVIKPSNWSTCPVVQCQGTSLYIGNSTTSSCNQTTCEYAGYTNQTILTSLASSSTCPGYSSGLCFTRKLCHKDGSRSIRLERHGHPSPDDNLPASCPMSSPMFSRMLRLSIVIHVDVVTYFHCPKISRLSE